jgi:myo-inositol 2-dehydrogenase/D-chiro-inositol 1-dehydrogenase
MENGMKKNTIAVFGAGRVSGWHINNMAEHLPDVRIKYLIDPFMNEQMEAMGRKAGVHIMTKDTQIAFDDPDVDCILIGTPAPTHCELIRKACAVQKDVFCEKPIGVDVDEIRHTLDVVEQAGIKLMMGFVRRFRFAAVREAIEQDRIGKPQLVIVFTRDAVPPPENYIKHCGGIFVDMTVHDFDLLRYFAGEDIVEISARAECLVDPVFQKYDDYDTTAVTVRFESGGLGIISNSRGGSFYDQKVEALGPKGVVRGGVGPESYTSVITSEACQIIKPSSSHKGSNNDAFIDEIKAFFRAINGEIPIPITGRDGLEAVLMSYAANLSVKENRPVRVDEIG